MRIAAIETSVVSLPFAMGGPHPLFAGRPWDRMDILLVKVETEDGLAGWGEAFGHLVNAGTQVLSDVHTYLHVADGLPPGHGAGETGQRHGGQYDRGGAQFGLREQQEVLHDARANAPPSWGQPRRRALP